MTIGGMFLINMVINWLKFQPWEQGKDYSSVSKGKMTWLDDKLGTRGHGGLKIKTKPWCLFNRVNGEVG